MSARRRTLCGVVLALAAGATLTGCQKRPALGDTVWADHNRNGVQDGGEPGVPGVTVNLLCNSEGVVSICQTATTNADGRYRFSGFVGGGFLNDADAETKVGALVVQVQFVRPEGFGFAPINVGSDHRRDSDADPGSGLAKSLKINVWFDGDLTIDAGLVVQDAGAGPTDEASTASTTAVPSTIAAATGATVPDTTPPVSAAPPPATGSVGGAFWKDLDADGLQDPEEAPETRELEGFPVALLDSEGQPLAATVVDEQGRYLFAGLPAGEYRVQFELPGNGNFVFAPPDAGDDKLDSDVDPATGQATLTLGPGEVNPSVGAGIQFTG